MATKSTNNYPVSEAAIQLRLVVDQPASDRPQMEHPVPWRLDDETKEIGRKGLARAREILHASRPTHFESAA